MCGRLVICMKGLSIVVVTICLILILFLDVEYFDLVEELILEEKPKILNRVTIVKVDRIPAVRLPKTEVVAFDENTLKAVESTIDKYILGFSQAEDKAAQQVATAGVIDSAEEYKQQILAKYLRGIDSD